MFTSINFVEQVFIKHNHVIRKFTGNGVVSNKLFDWNGGTNNNWFHKSELPIIIK